MTSPLTLRALATALKTPALRTYSELLREKLFMLQSRNTRITNIKWAQLKDFQRKKGNYVALINLKTETSLLQSRHHKNSTIPSPFDIAKNQGSLIWHIVGI